MGLHLEPHRRREFAALARRGRHKKRGAAAGPILAHGALHGDHGHAEDALDLAGRGGTVDHQLAGEQAEGRQVVAGVSENGEMVMNWPVLKSTS